MNIQPYIYVGSNQYAVKEMRLAIMDILRSKQEQETIRCALQVLEKCCRVDGTSITQCTFGPNAK